jgi:hypothetical protein
VSLFDVPLGVSELGEVTEDLVMQSGGRRETEAGVAVLPSWTARSEVDLTPAPGTGFPAAGRLLLPLAGTDAVQARQVAVATYGREGFEAAAVTGMAMLASFTAPAEVRRRTLILRFDRPYAAVAVAVEPPPRLDASAGQEARVYSRWFGVPVFGAWITEPSDSPA